MAKRPRRTWKSSITIEEVYMARTHIKPVHPGAYLREVLEELGVSQYRLAQDIGVAPMRISHVVRGQRPVTAELALRPLLSTESPLLAKLAEPIRYGCD